MSMSLICPCPLHVPYMTLTCPLHIPYSSYMSLTCPLGTLQNLVTFETLSGRTYFRHMRALEGPSPLKKQQAMSLEILLEN